MSSLLIKLIILLALVAGIGGYVLISQHRITTAEARARIAEGGEKILAGRLVQANASEHIVTVFVDRWHTVMQAGATITKEIPVYVNAQADAACTLPRGFVRVHDAAATGTALPATAGPVDAAPSGIALSAATGAIVDNYTTCRATAAQLTSLQDWVRTNSGQGATP